MVSADGVVEHSLDIETPLLRDCNWGFQIEYFVKEHSLDIATPLLGDCNWGFQIEYLRFH